MRMPFNQLVANRVQYIGHIKRFLFRRMRIKKTASNHPALSLPLSGRPQDRVRQLVCFFNGEVPECFYMVCFLSQAVLPKFIHHGQQTVKACSFSARFGSGCGGFFGSCQKFVLRKVSQPSDSSSLFMIARTFHIFADTFIINSACDVDFKSISGIRGTIGGKPVIISLPWMW